MTRSIARYSADSARFAGLGWDGSQTHRPARRSARVLWFLAIVAVLAQSSGAARDATEWSALDMPEDTRPSVATALTQLGKEGKRQAVAAALGEHHRRRKWAAWDKALNQGWQPFGWSGETYCELMAIKGPLVYVLKTFNASAAVSTGADVVRQTPLYDLSGAGQTVGVWDGGIARVSHQEFVGRVFGGDDSEVSGHATHVTGTIAAAGAKALATGMAPAISVETYGFDEDLAEVSRVAMSYPGEPNMIQISNHSYGWIAGWDYTGFVPMWVGTWGDRESDLFGRYDESARDWDALCYAAPYFLPFKAAGNDRTDSVPRPGELYMYYSAWEGWVFKDYESSSDPLPDAWDLGGYDTLASDAVAKNVVTIGAIDMPGATTRDVNAVTMTSFSSWGPTDDGRVKPDLVAQGVDLFSPIAASDRSYDTFSGTSMATPVACGTAALLPEYYDRLFPGQVMRGATLKALLIHTADDVGRPGPDYNFGWGLINARAAVEHIQAHFDSPGAFKIVEDEVDLTTVERSYSFAWDANSPICVTMVWTDPPGPEIEGLDNAAPTLVNDLDLRLIDPEGTVYEPFVLDPSLPAEPAGVGDNTRDNVEQVRVDTPQVAGIYEVRVTYKETPDFKLQAFSLLVSEQMTPVVADPNDVPETDNPDTPAEGE